MMRHKKIMRVQAVERWLLTVSPVVLFVLLCKYSFSEIKLASFIFMLGVLILMLLSFTRLKKHIFIRERVGYVFAAAMSVVIMDGISTLYAASGKLTLYAFVQVAAAFCLAVLLIALVPGDRQEAGARIARILTIASAIACVVSIDLISTQLLVQPILWLVGQTNAYMNGIEVGTRIVSIFRNPNVFAGITGIGTLLSLGLAADKTHVKEKCKYNSVLFINALAFLLAFSMGATASIGVAFIVLIIMCGAEKRGRMLVLMAETLLCALGAAAVISATSFDDWDGINLIPILVLILGTAAHIALDFYIGDKISAKLTPKKMMIVLVSAAVLAVAFAVLAINMTGAITLKAGETVRRSAYPYAGEYTFVVESSSPELSVKIVSQNYQEAMMHTETELYSGLASEAHFSVPEGSIVTYVTFTSPSSDVTIDTAELVSGEYREAVPLGYPLLPGFIANRLQGLKANENAIQRIAFFSDGLKLFVKSPILGHGMGGFQNGLKSVQPFYYETKNVHNHYIESMIDTGIIGLCLFVTTIVLGIIVAFRARKKHPLAPTLFAVVAYMAIHAGVEVVFSSYYYLTFAFAAFAVIDLCCGEKLKSKPYAGHTAALIIFLTVFSILLGRNLTAQMLMTKDPTLDNACLAIDLDYYEKSDYMVSFIMYSLESNDESVCDQAEVYAEKMRKDDMPEAYTELAEYYFASGDIAHGMELVERFVRYSISSSEDWNLAVTMLKKYYDESEEFTIGVQKIQDILTERIQMSLADISLTEDSKAFFEEICT